MPVKFRCMQCGQLLGISRRKVGMGVTCPKCHHPVTVPEEDRMELLSGPLTARIFEQSDFEKLITKRSRSSHRTAGDPDDSKIDSNVALIEEDAPPSSQSKLAKSKDTSNAARQKKPEQPPEIEPMARRPEILTADERTEATPIEPLPVAVAKAPVALPLPTPVPPPSEAAAARLPAQQSPIDDARLAVEWVAIVGMALAFAAGLCVGRYLLPAALPPSQAARGFPGLEAAPQNEPAQPAAVVGKIQFKWHEQRQPDAQASVLLFPAKVTPAEKIDVAALRPGAERDNGAARKRLQSLGGDQAFADAQGAFKLSALRPGEYWILAISAKATRERTEPIPADERANIAQFFGNVNDLLENQAHQLVFRRLTADAATTLDISFTVR